MNTFSQRYGYQKKELQLEAASDSLVRKVFAAFYQQEFDIYDSFSLENYTTGIEDMMITLGIIYEFPENRIIKKKNAELLQRYVLSDFQPWYFIYDFIEKYLDMADEKTRTKMVPVFNKILEEETAAYRIVGTKVIPITNEAEIETVNQASFTPFDTVNTHISKALNLYADRKNPDYENSVKESISAVEAMCCIITGTSGKQATLGNAIKKLKGAGVHIHPAMERAFDALYGYTSDENGIRHGGMDFQAVPAEDAKYMLVSCSAFVNYLVEKYSKLENKES